MSADNWGICPRCKAEAKVKQKEAFQKAVDAYGKVSAPEYEQLQTVAREPIDLEETLREDYEEGISEDGLFYIYYHAACQVCGFTHKFEHEEQLEINE